MENRSIEELLGEIHAEIEYLASCLNDISGRALGGSDFTFIAPTELLWVASLNGDTISTDRVIAFRIDKWARDAKPVAVTMNGAIESGVISSSAEKAEQTVRLARARSRKS